jgi:hypothetical protein
MTTQAKTHLVLATPCYGGQLTSAYFSSLLQLQEACMGRGIGLTILTDPGDALITRARQDLAAEFLAMPEATHLLFVDADIQFAPEQVLRLLAFDADMTAAAYPLKRYDWALVKALAQQGSDQLETANLHYVMELENPGASRGDFAKARYVGTGFLMMRRKALEAMMERYPELRYTVPGGASRSALFNCMLDEKTGEYLSEDYSFCRRWTAMGGEIWLDMRSHLAHVGQTTFQGDLPSKRRLSRPPSPPGSAP